jgi:hypothetical protein
VRFVFYYYPAFTDNSGSVLTQTQCERSTAHLSLDTLIICIEVTYYSLFSGLPWSPSPPHFDFWQEAEKLGQKAIDYADRNLEATALQFPSVTDRIAEFKNSVQDLVRSAEALEPAHGSLVARTNNFDEFFRRLSDKVNIILEELKVEFSEPLPEDRSQETRRGGRSSTGQAGECICRGLWTLASTGSRGKREVLACQTADTSGGPSCG